MPNKIYTLNFQPGIQRDGTQFSARGWIDGEWVRFQRGLPRKIGGYREIASTTEIVRGIYVTPNSPNFIVFYGTGSQLYALTINQEGLPIGAPVNRTPAFFQANASNDWQFDVMYSAPDSSSVLIAHAAPNLSSIASAVDRQIFYGKLDGVTTLAPNGFSVSGGVVVFHPFLFMFGNDGKVMWSEPNNPTTLRGEAIVAGDKILGGIPVRGGTSSPAGLLWTLTSLIRVTFTGNQNDDFNFDTISSESSILSSRGIIEYDNQYYFAGVDRFLVYNGTLQELPNQNNLNYFFDNLNYSQRQKVWATKVTRFGEIWWHYPTGNSAECTNAVIYNVRERTWYDTAFGLDPFFRRVGRSDGYFDQTFAKPIWSSTLRERELVINEYPLYMHEVGTDQVFSDGIRLPIESRIKSPSLSLCATAPDNSRSETDANLYLSRIEPDFNMSGNLSVAVTASQYAQSANEILLAHRTITPSTEKVDMTATGREIYIQFSTVGTGDDFEMGQVLLVGNMGDIRA